MALNDLFVTIGKIAELKRHEISVPHQRRSKSRSQPKKQHASVPDITAERLHRRIVNDADGDAQRPGKIKMHPTFAKVFRVSKNPSVTYRRRKTNRHNVESPAPHGFFKFREKLFWVHSLTRWKCAFLALGH